MRHNKRKSRRRRGRRIFSFFLILVMIGVIVASVTMFFQTAEIQVTGVSKYTADEIIAASGIQVGDNLFAMNKFEVERRIKEQYPYVAEVKIRRRLPDTFLFTVTERVAVAYLDVGEQRWILDKHAYLLEPLSISEEVPYLRIVSESEAVEPASGKRLVLPEETAVDALDLIMDGLFELDIVADVSQIDISKLYRLTFLYQNRLQVQLGNSERMEKKLRLFHTILNELYPTDRGVLDVSLPPEGRFQPNSSIGIGG